MRRPSLFLTTLWVLSLTACDGGSTVKGHVQSLSGDPLRGAAVRLLHQRHEEQVSTGLDGSFRVGFLHEPGLGIPLRLEVSMPNHRGVTIDLVGTAEYECTVRLADESDKNQGVLALGSTDMCRKIER